MRAVQREALCAARLACECSAQVVQRELNRGIGSLALIAGIAPWLGVLSMLESARNLLEWYPIHSGLDDAAGGPSEVFVLLAAAIAVACFAIFAHAVLSAQLERFQLEMKLESLQLLNDLVRPSGKI